MYKFNRLKQGFLNTLKEDMVMTWQEHNETLECPDLFIPNVWDGMIENLLTDIVNQMSENDLLRWCGRESEFGGDLYIGLMYDSHNTPLDKMTGVEGYCDLSPLTSPDYEGMIEFEGYIQFNGIKYS